MLKEIAHFAWHAPATLRARRRLGQAGVYELLMERAEAAGLGARRAALVADLTGDVLEIGAGTGRMFAHYPRGVRVVALEPDAEFAALARVPAGAPIEIRIGRGEAVPAPDESFDAVVLALVLCSVEAPGHVLAEARRVLRPGGALRLIEHVRSERAVAGWLMDRLDGTWHRLNQQGCHMNRDPLPAIAAAGFTVQSVDPFQFYAAGLPAFPMRVIRAARAR